MNSPSPLKTLLAIVVAGLILASIYFWPNWWKSRFGADTPAGPEVLHEAKRKTLKTTADVIARDMSVAARQKKMLDDEVRGLAAGDLERVLRLPKVQRTAYPARWEEARAPLDPVTASEFEALKDVLSEARKDLSRRGTNPEVWRDALDHAQRILQTVKDHNASRLKALDEVKAKFVQP